MYNVPSYLWPFKLQQTSETEAYIRDKQHLTPTQALKGAGNVDSEMHTST